MIAAAVLIKLLLFLYVTWWVPQAIFSYDSFSYIRDAQGWMDFFHTPSAGLRHSFYRTPGYPFFLAIFYGGGGVSFWGVVFLQIALNILTAVVVYKAVIGLGRCLGLLSAAIVLLDLPTTIYSTMILTESLHLFVISLFLFTFIKYLDGRRMKWLVIASLFLGASVYIRPVGYYLGFAVAGFIVFFGQRKKIYISLVHAILSLLLVYGFLGIWEYQNLKAFGEFSLCNIDHVTVQMHGLLLSYARENNPQLKQLPPVVYYVSTIVRNFFSLMATPGSMRHYGSWALRIFGVSFGYLLVIFWWTGLIAGIFKDKKDVVYMFLMMVVLYFVCVTIVSVGWGATARFRVPMVSSLAILSARGWFMLLRSYGDQKS